MQSRYGTPASEPREVGGTPGGLVDLLRAARPRKSRSGDVDLSGLCLRRPEVRVERDQVDRYAQVCGFPRKDTAPFTFVHVLAFGLHLQLMNDPRFPFPAMGNVHVENRIAGHRPIHIGETVSATSWVTGPAPHRKGRTTDFHTAIHADGELVWESVSTYLTRGASNPDAPAGGLALADVAPSGTRWRVPADQGRRYAAVAGDRNPIHLSALSAKPFGFPRAIAHGMWSLARCVAALENRLPDAAEVAVSFRKPILLPSTVQFGSRPVDGGYDFSLSSRSGSTHLLGSARPLG